MAQRTIHYLFGDIFSEQVEIKNKQRFLLGSVLPDAYADVCDRNKTHFKRKLDETNQICFDFDSFKEQYFELMQKDDLYLGYYMHLVEDAFYREYIYCGRFNMPCSKEEVAVLHNDYHILNNYIVKSYNICNIIQKPAEFQKEPICNVAAFRVDKFIDDMSCDFTEKTSGKTIFVTEDMLDEFIDTYAKKGIEELKSIQSGKSFLKAVDLAYPINR